MPKHNKKFPQYQMQEYVDLSEFEDLFLKDIVENTQATDQDEIPGAMGRFGFDQTNPIPIHGIPNAKIYLSNLCFSDGHPIQFSRIGSIWESTINLPIDAYQIYDGEGKEIAILYISPYHLKCTEKTPAGFLTKHAYIKNIQE
jgi:hypothetical protein